MPDKLIIRADKTDRKNVYGLRSFHFEFYSPFVWRNLICFFFVPGRMKVIRGILLKIQKNRHIRMSDGKAFEKRILQDRVVGTTNCLVHRHSSIEIIYAYELFLRLPQDKIYRQCALNSTCLCNKLQ